MTIQRECKEATQAKLERITVKHAVQLENIIKEHHAQVARTRHNQFEAPEKFKEETS